MFFNKDKQTDNAHVEEAENKKEEVTKVEPKMVWVDGYKGTDKDMKCRDFQYELGKEFTYDGKLDLCSSGFHACKDLSDVFNYYGLGGGNRFFKIKALVPEDYDKDFHKTTYYGVLNVTDTKFVTAKIKFISECTYDDFKAYVSWNYPMIENEEEFKNHLDTYDVFSKNKFIRKMMDFGYSESFATAIGNDSNDYRYILSYVQAFEDENISKDLRIYMLVDKVKSYKSK